MKCHSARLSNKVLTVILTISMMGASILPGLSTINVYADASSAYTTLSSFSGHPDTTLTISGGGYTGGETVNITAVQGNVTVASATALATKDGSFISPLILPIKLAQGTVTVTATGKTSGMSSSNGYYAVPFQASLVVSGSSTTPFGTLSVSGSGFGASETVDLNFSGSVTKVTTSAKGDFADSTIVTPNMPAGSYQLMAVGEGSGASATAYEYVNGFFPSSYPSSYFLLPGNTLSFSGSGFAPGEAIDVIDPITSKALNTFVASSTGSFTSSGMIIIPFSAAGTTVNYGLVGRLSHASTTVSTGVGKYYPSASPSIYYALPGSTLSFYGNGFLAGETVQVSNGKTVLATTVADNFGTLSQAGAVTVPVTASGTTQTYTLTGLTSQGVATVSLSVGAFNPSVSPSSYYATPGSNLSFTGSGFAADETVNVLSGKTVVGTITTDKAGMFAAAGTVPIRYALAGGSADFTLVGQSSNAKVEVSVGVAPMQTSLNPSVYYALPYAPFTAGVTGFVPGETVELTIGQNVVGSAMADILGSASFTNIIITPTTLGSINLIATGKTSNATSNVSIAVGAYAPSISASNYYTQPGSKITLNGSGFAPGESINFLNGHPTDPTDTGNALALAVPADAKGNVNVVITLPFGQVSNSLVITAIGTLSGATSSTTITLAPFDVQVTPSTYYDRSGTPVSFTGSGFVSGEKVTMSLNGVAASSIVASAKGNITIPVSLLPFAKTAAYSFIGSVSGAKASVNVGLAKFYARIQLSNYYGNGGSTVTVMGSGFAAGEPITIASNGKILAIATSTATGALSQPVTIPYSAPGDITITATGSQSGAVATTGFTIAKVYASMQLGAYAVPAGNALTLIGSGYLPGEPIIVTGDRLGVSYTVTADKNGNVSDNGALLPLSLVPGNLKLTFTGTYSFTSNAITMYVQ